MLRREGPGTAVTVRGVADFEGVDVTDRTRGAIETRYAGCRFRSRLEARWAVFFDTLGIRWEYEAQGFTVGRRLTAPWSDGDTFPYLPDFWLPDLHLYAEVKGDFADEQEFVRLLDAAAFLSSKGVGGCGEGPDLLLLGPIPRYASIRPVRLHLHKGGLGASSWSIWGSQFDGHGCGGGDYVAQDGGGHRWSDIDVCYPKTCEWSVCARTVLGGFVDRSQGVDADVRVARGYRAARSARFEYGETPR